MYFLCSLQTLTADLLLLAEEVLAAASSATVGRDGAGVEVQETTQEVCTGKIVAASSSVLLSNAEAFSSFKKSQEHMKSPKEEYSWLLT